MEHASPDTAFIDHIDMACPNCRPIVTFNPSLRQRIVEHISAHILHDPSVDRLSEPCGLCLQPVPLCKIVLKKAKGRKGNLAIDMKASSCPNLVKLSIRVATGCSDSSPCTNRPIVCPHCDDSEASPVVWSYNFRSHLLRKHPRISLEDHSDIWVLKKLEKEGMQRVWENRSKRKSYRKSQCAPLVISETHRLRLVLKCVSLLYISTALLTHRIYISEVLPGTDTSDGGSSSDRSSVHDEEVTAAQSGDDEDDTMLAWTPVVKAVDDSREIQDLEYGRE